MIRLRFNRASLAFHLNLLWQLMIVAGCALLFAASAWSAGVAQPSAHEIAQGQVRHHIAVFGSWNGSTSPDVQNPEPLYRDGNLIGYHFPVLPSGYVIVAANDLLSPVPFYSTRSSFDRGRSKNPLALESWMVDRLNQKAEAALELQKRAASLDDDDAAAVSSSRIRDAWTYLNRLGGQMTDVDYHQRSNAGPVRGGGQILRGAAVSPLLTTVWGQDTPYNSVAPDDACTGGHTLTGCVATAWAQVLKYWQWPPHDVGGDGSHTYTWKGASVTESLSADFTNTEAFQWTDMADDLTAPGTTQLQIDAVSKLMYVLGVSTEMDFGCPESPAGSASTRWADEVLDTYFNYKPMTAMSNRLDVSNYTAAEWFGMIKNELDQDPPRPIVFSMGSPSGWHEVVIDGYQTGVADKVHINFGWEGNYDAYYDITDDDDFNTPGTDWNTGYNQVMVIGIEPDNIPPVVQAGVDANVEELTSVTLTVESATDPEGLGVSRYQWSQISGPSATINDPSSAAPVIITPDVHTTSNLVFQVKVYDVNRAFGTDESIITVNNTDGSASAPTTGSSSGGGGGCFLNLFKF
jgi:hypothetical protein